MFSFGTKGHMGTYWGGLGKACVGGGWPPQSIYACCPPNDIVLPEYQLGIGSYHGADACAQLGLMEPAKHLGRCIHQILHEPPAHPDHQIVGEGGETIPTEMARGV
jgi:hypothetical protein